MPKEKQYWPDEWDWNQALGGFALEARSLLAWKLIEHFATVAATIEGEDSAGRAKMRLQVPAELVARAFEIADVYVDTAEARGEIRPGKTQAEKDEYQKKRQEERKQQR